MELIFKASSLCKLSDVEKLSLSWHSTSDSSDMKNLTSKSQYCVQSRIPLKQKKFWSQLRERNPDDLILSWSPQKYDSATRVHKANCCFPGREKNFPIWTDEFQLAFSVNCRSREKLGYDGKHHCQYPDNVLPQLQRYNLLNLIGI
jgi:hypothetical protein